MKYNIKAMVSGLALVAWVTGCAPAPSVDTQVDGATTGTNYGGTAPAPAGNYYNTSTNTAAYTQPTSTEYANQPVADNNYNASGYEQPQPNYDYSAPGSSNYSADYSSYNSGGGNAYGGGNYASNNYSGSNYSSGYSSGGYGGSSYSSGYSSGSRSGSYAVQVVASSSRSTAESMQRQMQSMGYSAVVDAVGGLYKVRVPFKSESEAKSNLNRIRSSIPDAFFTTR